MKSLHNYHRVWKQFGFTPEFYNIPQAEAGTNREGYPLRPELIESVMYLYRATRDPWLIQVGVDMLRSLQHSAKTTCGYATINDVRDHRKADRMESFFLAETTKYLYLLFDTDNFIHNTGSEGEIIDTQWGRCVVDAGGYIFNTEAHPIDPGALYCCRPAQEIFPDKRPVLKRFLPTQNTPEDNITPNDLRIEKDVTETKNPGVLPITIAKLSEIRHYAVNKKEGAVNESFSSSNASSPRDSAVENATVEEVKKSNQTVRLPTQILAPSSTIYKADDSDSSDSFESPILSNGQYSTSSSATVQNSGIRQNATPSPIKTRFEPQIMLENIRRGNLYPTNVTARQNYQILSCQAQPFLQRMSIIGEFF
ncbi:ER degradation-enhancing alpha-mannosidase-like protein 2 [Formica fusca]